jgi:hypothetical protein
LHLRRRHLATFCTTRAREPRWNGISTLYESTPHADEPIKTPTSRFFTATRLLPIRVGLIFRHQERTSHLARRLSVFDLQKMVNNNVLMHTLRSLGAMSKKCLMRAPQTFLSAAAADANSFSALVHMRAYRPLCVGWSGTRASLHQRSAPPLFFGCQEFRRWC